ncbi:MAG: hypothetical protein ABF690_10100 [Liquorilactobacillus nagelii]|uniref:hypothetical protein n=1 Tax=Liquorilactobacillus ghanensis TaxID=399370 RepID=UPI0039ED7854
MGKKLIGAGILATMFLLTACGGSKSSDNSSVQTGNHKLYSVKVNKVAENDTHDWVLSGTSKAPNGTKIIVTPSNPESLDYGEVGAESKARASWAKVEDGKFTVLVDPVEIIDGKETQGQKVKASVFAISKYNKPWTHAQISKKIVSTARKNFQPKTLTVSSGQAHYYASLDKDSSSSSSSTSSKPSSSSSSSSENSSQPYGSIHLTNIKALAVSQDTYDKNSQHYLVKHNNKYYLVNYTGKNYYDSKGNEAVSGATISFKGDETGYGNITKSLVNEDKDFEAYQGQKVIIVESNHLSVSKAY